MESEAFFKLAGEKSMFHSALPTSSGRRGDLVATIWANLFNAKHGKPSFRAEGGSLPMTVSKW